MARPDFTPFPKIARLSREVVITEKIDGTNAQVFITDDGEVFAGSRTRWITSQDDNYGFAAWVDANKTDLLRLGPGAHFGEWWGGKIQRGYGMSTKQFSLFNTFRWTDPPVRPTCCGVVPELFRGDFNTNTIQACLEMLALVGSVAAPGFMKPEGIVIYHAASGQLFKKTIEKDESPKGGTK